jgi:S-adenosylmethionine:tRNA ribosyltransferase-isomerase
MDNLLYDYHLPDDLIGKNPPKIRHDSRLLIYNTQSDELLFDVFLNVFKYLPKNSALVFNDTRVIPARIFLNKETGGKLETFFLVNEWDGNTDFVPVLFDRKMTKGEKILFDGVEIGTVSFQKEKIFFIKFNGSKDNLFDFLNENGKTPIPKYIKNSELSETDLRERYQTVFASNPSSVAAPTASLHFTDQVFESLDRIGIEKCLFL